MTYGRIGRQVNGTYGYQHAHVSVSAPVGDATIPYTGTWYVSMYCSRLRVCGTVGPVGPNTKKSKNRKNVYSIRIKIYLLRKKTNKEEINLYKLKLIWFQLFNSSKSTHYCFTFFYLVLNSEWNRFHLFCFCWYIPNWRINHELFYFFKVAIICKEHSSSAVSRRVP